MSTSADFNIRSREHTKCPFPAYERLRADAPVSYVEAMDCWVVSTYELCLQALKDPESFRQWEGNEMHDPDNGPPYGKPSHWSPGVREVMQDAVMPVSTLVTANPPRHTKYRRLAMSLFSARRTADTMQPQIEQIIHDLIDGFSGGRVEFVEEFAVPLPMKVVAGILDVPPELHATFAAWADASVMTSAGRTVSKEEMVVHARHIVDFQRYFLPRLAERRDHPGEDVVSFLANATVDDEGTERPLTDREQLGLLLHFLTAGYETSANLLGSLLRRILLEPGLQDRLRESPELIPAVVEETLRYEGPVQGKFRHTTREVILGEVAIPAGSKVLLLLGSANRDDAKFADAATFDPERPGLRNHLAFGFGTHFCLGAPLARKEVAMAVEALLGRVQGLRLDPEQPAETVDQLFYGFSALHLVYDRVLTRS